MQRFVTVMIAGLILVLGIGLGLGARAVLDWRGAGTASTAASGAVTVGPTLSTPIQAAAAPATREPTRLASTATPAARDVVVEVTESQLDSQLNGLLVGKSLGTTPLGEASVQTVNVQLRDSLIRVGGGAKAGFLQAPFLAAGTVVPNNEGRPVVKVSQASVGGVDLPESVRTALAESLQTRVDELLSDHLVRIRTIDIADGKMRLVGTSGS
jgi:hypothetical protein